MKVGSLFSGIGGLDLALEAFGGEVVWQCDSDPFCRAVLAKHWPGVRCYEDVRDIDATAVPVDVICGGFPCQPVSVAGRRKGKNDARWLWPEFARIVSVLRPHAVFIENVPGLRTLGLRDVLADLAGLGFDAEWGCFTAAEVGAPHIRRRLFVLAYANGELRGLQPGRFSGKTGADSSVTGDDGAPRDVADAKGDGRRSWRARRPAPGGSREPEQTLQNLADADGHREQQPKGRVIAERGWVSNGGWWSVEPDVDRVAARIPGGVDRLRALGNAVVPQQAALAWETLTARVAAYAEGA
jgi:DNA (cytosine-5)-methyltransferase 1